MLNLAKYAAVAALAVGLGVAATKPASAWGYNWGYSCGDGCGYGYGAFGPFLYGFYPYPYPYPYGYDFTSPRGQAHEPALPVSARESISPAHAGVRSCARAGCGKPARPVR
jgi:hypothetical protein